MTGPGPADERSRDEGIRRWLQHRRGPGADLASVVVAASGYSNETLVVTVEPTGERLVLRLAPTAALFPDYDFHRQAAHHRLAADHGVPAPTPAEVEEDPTWLGRPFLVMPFVDGTVPNEAPVFDAWINESSLEQQATLRRNFIDALAAIHRVDAPPGRPLENEVAWWADYLEWATEGRTVRTVTDAFAWCRSNLPGRRPEPSLLWGDVRLGNVIFGADREVRAVIDWEMAGAGPAEVDVGYLVALEEVQERLFGRRVPGFGAWAEDQARYEAGLGRPVADLGWYRTFGLARAVAINLRQAVLAERAGAEPTLPCDETNPLVALLGERIR